MDKPYIEQIRFSCERTGDKECKCRSCVAANALATQIQQEISNGTFNYAKYFPKSKALRNLGIVTERQDYTFREYWQEWYDEKVSLKGNSLSKYKSNILKVMPIIGDLDIRKTKQHHIAKLIQELCPKYSPKVLKDIRGDISSVFKRAIANGLIHKNPCDGVKTPPIPKTDADPLSMEEAGQILSWMEKNHPSKLIYFAIALYTGMRPGEIIGLRWKNVNVRLRNIHICEQRTKGKIDTPKTGERTITILPQLLPYLEKQRESTESDYVVVTSSGEHFTSTRKITDLYRNPCLDALGIRRRPLKQLRHTFACIMLQNGMDKFWIATGMLGHTTTRMLEETYGKFIPATPDDSKFDFLNVIKSARNGM